MSKLEALPEIFLEVLLTEWNGTKELASFDTAYCSKLYRPSLLKIYTGESFAVCLTQSDTNKSQKWIFSKQIKPKGLLHFRESSLWDEDVLTNQDMEDHPFLFLKVTSLMFCWGYRCCESDDLDDEHLYVLKMVRFLNMCPNLQHISVWFCHSFRFIDLFRLMDQKILKNMTGFDLKSFAKFCVNMEVMNHISLTCSQVINLELSLCDWNESGILDLLDKHSKSLLYVTLKDCIFTDILLDKLVESLSERVKTLSLCGASDCGNVLVTLKYACKLLTSSKEMTHLHINQDISLSHRISVAEIRVVNINNTFCSFYLNHLPQFAVEERHNLLLKCPTVHKLSLTFMTIKSPLFISTVMVHSPNLHTISLKECVLSGESFSALKKLFVECSNLAVLKMKNCQMELFSDTLVHLLSDLPVHLTSLLIGFHDGFDVTSLLSIVRSNQHLETIWYARCKLESTDCDKASIGEYVQACGGEKLVIIEEEFPQFLADEFFLLER